MHSKEEGYGLSVDIWSLGCTIIEMATAKPPWSQCNGVRFFLFFSIYLTKKIQHSNANNQYTFSLNKIIRFKQYSKLEVAKRFQKSLIIYQTKERTF